MIPLTDANRRPVNFPVMTLLIIIVNFVVFSSNWRKTKPSLPAGRWSRPISQPERIGSPS